MHSVTISSISAATYDYQLTNLFFLIYFQLSTLSILKKIHFFHLKSQYFLHISRPRFENSKSSLPSYKTTDTITLISFFIYHSNHFIIIKPCFALGGCQRWLSFAWEAEKKKMVLSIRERKIENTKLFH